MFFNYMSNYFEHKIIYKGISFQLSNRTQIEEREIHPYHEILFFIDGDGEFLAETGKGFSQYITVVGLCETVALFALVFSMVALG